MQLPQYVQVANAQKLAAQQTISAQQKQASMFSGGGGSETISPNMGGNNENSQLIMNKIAGAFANAHSLASKDYRVGGRGKYRTRRKKINSRRKKHNKRISKRKQYKRR